MKDDFSINACYNYVEFEVESFGANPFEELGKAIIRAEFDPFFNKRMIEAWKIYIRDHNLQAEA